MITVELAARLRAAGLTWTPAPGDRFVMADPAVRVDAGLDDVFVVSHMTVDVADAPGGPHIRFNGTTEWALDSVEKEETLWLPRESQLRERLGPAFRRLEAVPGGFVVVLARPHPRADDPTHTAATRTDDPTGTDATRTDRPADTDATRNDDPTGTDATRTDAVTEERHVDLDAECAYARALLALLGAPA